jgi:hypothetical protein
MVSLPDDPPSERTVVDFRSRRSSSVEGSANALRARQLQIMRRGGMDGDLDPVRALRGAGWSDDLLGFWVLWHLAGGFEALVELGWHPTTVWRKIRRFRMLTGEHPDDLRFAGVTIDVDRFWASIVEPPPAQKDA